jgi:hypothetical protein
VAIVFKVSPARIDPSTAMEGGLYAQTGPGRTFAIYIIDPGMKQRIVIPVNILTGQTTVRPYRLG